MSWAFAAVALATAAQSVSSLRVRMLLLLRLSQAPQNNSVPDVLFQSSENYCASAPLRRRQHANINAIKSRHGVFLRPQRDMAVLPARALEGGEQNFLIERHLEVVVIERDRQCVPAVRHDIGFRAVDTRGLAVCEEKEVDALLEGIGADRVVAVRIAQADRKARGQRWPRNDLQTDLHLEVLCGNRLVDREREAIVMLVGAD